MLYLSASAENLLVLQLPTGRAQRGARLLKTSSPALGADFYRQLKFDSTNASKEATMLSVSENMASKRSPSPQQISSDTLCTTESHRLMQNNPDELTSHQCSDSATLGDHQSEAQLDSSEPSSNVEKKKLCFDLLATPPRSDSAGRTQTGASLLKRFSSQLHNHIKDATKRSLSGC
ncbi:hypothetical protein SRHO_G00211060 [Serrasalmus rhombeus]